MNENVSRDKMDTCKREPIYEGTEKVPLRNKRPKKIDKRQFFQVFYIKIVQVIYIIKNKKQ